MIASVSTIHAADAVGRSDLGKAVGQGKLDSEDREDREYTLITRNGTAYRSRHLVFLGSDKILVSTGVLVPFGDVAKIQIKHHKEWGEAIGQPARVLPAGEDLIFSPLLIPWLAGALLITGATAPVTVAAEGIRRLLPAKVITVKP